MWSNDEFLGDGEERAASCLELFATVPGAKDWQKKLAELSKTTVLPAASELTLSAFSLIRGGDLFERTGAKIAKTPASLLETYADKQLRLVKNGAAKEEQEAAMRGVLRVLRGNAALVKRMLIAKPVSVVIIPKDHDYRPYGFPRNTNPNAAGIFWNSAKTDVALLGLREELILEKAHLMVHEMTHAVHFLAFTKKEREDIDRFLLPVYRNRRWVDEAVAIYAERAFGARYAEEELRQPDLYGKTRRDWNDQQVFSKFIAELMRP
jgi:hypothetical protein